MGSLTDIKNALAEKNKNKTKSKTKVSSTEGMIRAGLGQGIAFGFGDELEALYKSRTRGTKYEDELKEARDKISAFRETNPGLAYGSEIGGAVLPAVFTGGASLLGRAGLKGASTVGKAVNLAQTGGIKGAGKLGLTQGALYGAGTGESAEGRILGAVGGGVVGGAVGKTAGAILPKTTELAKKMLDRGVGLTGGQSVKGSGSLGNLLYGIEQSSTSIPGVGTAISQAKTKSLSEFNKFAMLEAVEPILDKESKKILQKQLKNVNGTEAFELVNNFVSKKYSEIIPKLKLSGKDIVELQDSFVNIIAKSDTDEKAKDLLLKRVKKLFEDKIQVDKQGQRFISGKDVKALQTTLTNDTQEFMKKGGFDRYVGDAFNDIKKALDKKINIESAVPSTTSGTNLKKLNLAFAQLKPIGDAVAKAFNSKGIFSSSQLLTAIKQADKSVNKKISKEGKNLMLNVAREGEDIFGQFVPDSGTASRLIAGEGAISPANLLRYVAPTIIAQGLYGVGRIGGRGLLNAPITLAEGVARTGTGLLGGGEAVARLPQEQMQNLMNYRMQQWQFQITALQLQTTHQSMVLIFQRVCHPPMSITPFVVN